MSSGFISENEIANQRKIRQEEWEKVRTADQPEEAPEEQYDPRSLYDRLKEQKDKKEFEYEEAHKLKNMIKGLDDEEVEFLDLVDKSKYEEEKRKYLEESKELNEFRMKRACLEEEHLAQRIKNEIKSSTKSNPSSNKISSQSKLLPGVVVKKSSPPLAVSNDKGTKRKLEEGDQGEDNGVKKVIADALSTDVPIGPIISPTSSTIVTGVTPDSTALQCVGILPGIGDYDRSSDSDASSSDFESSEQQLDLCGRKIVKKKPEEESAEN
uniref:Protein FAM192A n=1 Tax=Cacopsylla melanoneura TaxID=428564 RepID=A0A8D8WW64_9HEMI